MPKWNIGTIIKTEDCSPTTKRFWLKSDNPDLTFKAGQFLVLDLPIHEKRHKRWRSYSIANAPDDSGIFELVIVHLEGGAGTTYLFEEATIGTEISFKNPSGVFTLPGTIQSDLVFICTGTGVAPFRSMIFDIYNNKKNHSKIHLIFGTRHANGILYQEEFEALAKKENSFEYSIALSREETNFSKKGYVHELYENKYALYRENIHFYICGWSNMIDEAVARLKELGYPESQIHFELYG